MAKDSHPEFLPEAIDSIYEGLKEIGAGEIQVTHLTSVRDSVRWLWDQKFAKWMRSARLREAAETGYKPGERSEWFLGMTDEFRKGVAIVDRKLQGRVLEAISYIARTPLSSKGDTVKALSGDLKNLWRYRIGDYRLVYRPDEARRQVMLVAFTSREGAYG